MSLTATQLPARFAEICEKQRSIFRDQRPSVTVQNRIPSTSAINLRASKDWFRIPDVICVFADMANSTALSAQSKDITTAAAYQLFTGTAVEIFDQFDASYIDVKGDGVFALFNQDQAYRAFAAAMTFKTFSREVFVPSMKEKGYEDVGAHIGIDQKTVLVHKIGIRQRDGQTDRQNEVWAGKPVNMAAKLASLTPAGTLLVSDRYFERITHERVRLSCGCVDAQTTGPRTNLWLRVPVDDKPFFDFEDAWRCTSNWCRIHGAEYCDAILALDEPS